MRAGAALQHPQARAVGMVVDVPDGQGGTTPGLGSPLTLSGISSAALSPAQPAQGAPLWSSAFLPAAFQGTLISNLKKPIDNLDNPNIPAARQRRPAPVLRGFARAARDARHEERRPVSRSTYRLYRELERQAGSGRYRLTLGDIAGRLPKAVG